MPYIIEERRSDIWDDSNSKGKFDIRNPGELNFFISDRLNDYIKEKGLSYQTINDILGALEGAKMEFYRRVAVPYEGKKLIDNGDVYHV